MSETKQDDLPELDFQKLRDYAMTNGHYHIGMFAELERQKERAEKAEAEVERLQGLLSTIRAVIDDEERFDDHEALDRIYDICQEVKEGTADEPASE